MDHTRTYLELAAQGLDAFLRLAAPAALVRETERALKQPAGPMRTMSIGAAHADRDRPFEPPAAAHGFEIYPLMKRSSAPFAGMLSLGRTSNNDVVISDVSVSRFHLYFKRQDDAWVVCDAGSRNGTVLDERRLQPNVRVPIASGAALRIGNVPTRFFTADALFEWLRVESTKLAFPRS